MFGLIALRVALDPELGRWQASQQAGFWVRFGWREDVDDLVTFNRPLNYVVSGVCFFVGIALLLTALPGLH